MRLELLAALNRERAARRAAAVVTDLGSGEQRLVPADAMAADPLADLLASRLASGRGGVVEHDGRALFVAVQVPPVRLVVIGAVHVSQALAPMARLAGFAMTVIDPRTAFATVERFPDCAVVPAWPDEALRGLGGLDRFTAVAALTHDPKIDDPALAAALSSDCIYVGALGSRKTHAARLARLAALGFGPEATDRIHAPIGLDISAVSPAEIAVSILAQVILALRRKPTRAERDGGGTNR
ncbi:XdhC family protein [Lichenihabitans sp. Uapishka_5]|uniref:XdhC family protein n=1 Tax=Lichenihabitans sp. Uapishka_5 TaxID=3037302 RepID=UPI0029E829AA|nr:XdhC family protein [Lichenihabitans sp. Uapishka_5]MDX7949601.1 XdhC family protein [Lichenihabitans sp. Uapishka_5]